ncbi:hypothetical protein MOSE0_N12882 [Monosporozyma servazzii]
MSNKFVVLKRFFSQNLVLPREWKQIETRKVAIPQTFKIGDIKPVYMPNKIANYPDYPYGDSRIFKQSNTGLYGGSFIQFGNSISESKHKIRRKWYPNVIHKRLWSEALNKMVQLKLTTKVLRTISHEGGLDNYLCKDKPARIKELGPFGWKLRYDVLIAQGAKKSK